MKNSLYPVCRTLQFGKYLLGFVIIVILAFSFASCAVARDEPRDRPMASWVQTTNGLPTNGEYWGVLFSDINKDNKLDVIAANTSSGNVEVYTGDGAGNWTALNPQLPKGGGSDIIVGDFDGDGNPDIFAGAGSKGGIHLYKGNGAGGFTEVTSGSNLPTSSNWRGLALGDVNKDGKLDLAATNGWGSTYGIHVFLGDGTGKFTEGSNGLPSNQDTGSGTVLVDFNKDSNLDVTGGWDNAAVYLGNGGGGGGMSWTESSSGLISGGHFTGVDTTDFNKDGSIDLIISSYSGGGLLAYKNVNNAASWESTSNGLPKSGGYMDLTTADFNNDGSPDVATAGYNPGGKTGIHVFNGDGTGNWVEESSGLPTSNSYAGCDSGDFNNDGKVDLVLGRQDGKGIDVYRNIMGGGSPPPTVLSTNPVNGVNNVPKNTNIAITFSTAMDQAATEGAVSASPSITGSFTWDGTSKTMTWTPSADLQVSTKYTINIGTSAKSMDGMPLESPYSFSFTTGTSADNTHPSISSTNPTNGQKNVDPGGKVTITFSEPMDHTATESAVSISPGSITGKSWSDDKTLVLSVQLEGGRSYNVTVSMGAKDLAGNAMASPNAFSFTTKKPMGDGGGNILGLDATTFVMLVIMIIVLVAVFVIVMMRRKKTKPVAVPPSER